MNKKGNRMAVLAIVGSQEKWLNLERKCEARIIISDWLEFASWEKVVSGGADGIDTLAINMARDAGFPIQEFLPKNDRWQPEGYMERNILIAEACHALVAIRSKTAKTFGSGWTANHAEKIGKWVCRYEV